jgi:hypothetical protein
VPGELVERPMVTLTGPAKEATPWTHQSTSHLPLVFEQPLPASHHSASHTLFLLNSMQGLQFMDTSATNLCL